MTRSTVVASEHILLGDITLAAARQARGSGLHVKTVAWMAARLAGGFLAPIDPEALSVACGRVLADDVVDLGDLAAIRELPGMRGTLVSTLQQAWSAGYDLAEHAGEHPRIAALARIEEAVLTLLPLAQPRQSDLVERALSRLAHAPSVLGPIDFRGFPDLDRCWRPLVIALAGVVRVTWDAGPMPPPAWLEGSGIEVRRAHDRTPAGMRTFSCASNRHEATEAMRWVRSLLASGDAKPQDIAIAAASPSSFDDFVLAAAEESGLWVHFAHGRSVLQTREGQTAAALADVLLRGLSQERVRRLASVASDKGSPFANLPEGWRDLLPRDAPLDTPERWRQVLAGEDKQAVADALLPIIDLLAEGPDKASEAGEHLLRGPARALWRRALANAPGSALEHELGRMSVPDEGDPAQSILWAPASTLAASPRPFVWLLGLNAQTWPRASADDPLLPQHILGEFRLEELTRGQQDRRDFELIRATASREIRVSFSRREISGRKLGLSPLIDEASAELLYRTAVPEHAMSEPDRMLARPDEFRTTPPAVTSAACWRNWHDRHLTAHDGVVPANHPAILRAIGRVHSATSLELLIRNPIGFMFKYALGMDCPRLAEDELELNAFEYGTLVHGLLDSALTALAGPDGTLGPLDGARVHAVVADAVRETGQRWENERPVPPPLLWRVTLERAAVMAVNALLHPLEPLPGGRAFTEVPFGDSKLLPDGKRLPWDPHLPVAIQDVGLLISGRIDRLELSGDSAAARVIDYKSGRAKEGIVLRGGRELQRCLYGYAVKSLLGVADITSALLYPSERPGNTSDNHYAPLEDADATMSDLAAALATACENLRAGKALPGVAAGLNRDDTKRFTDNRQGEHDNSAFALPVVPGTMLEPKKHSARCELGTIPAFWEVV